MEEVFAGLAEVQALLTTVNVNLAILSRGLKGDPILLLPEQVAVLKDKIKTDYFTCATKVQTLRGQVQTL